MDLGLPACQASPLQPCSTPGLESSLFAALSGTLGFYLAIWFFYLQGLVETQPVYLFLWFAGRCLKGRCSRPGPLCTCIPPLPHPSIVLKEKHFLNPQSLQIHSPPGISQTGCHLSVVSTGDWLSVTSRTPQILLAELFLSLKALPIVLWGSLWLAVSQGWPSRPLLALE